MGCGADDEPKPEIPEEEVVIIKEDGVLLEIRLHPVPLSTSGLLQVRTEGSFPPGHRPLVPAAPLGFGDLSLREAKPASERLDAATGRTEIALTWVYEPFLPGKTEFPPLEFATHVIGEASGAGAGLLVRTPAVAVEVVSAFPAGKTPAGIGSLELPPGTMDTGATATQPDRTSALRRKRTWITVLVVGLLCSFWIRAGRHLDQNPETPPLSAQSLDRLRALIEEDKADPTTLGAVFDDHLRQLRPPPPPDSPAGRLREEVEDRLQALRFSRESRPDETAAAVALLRRFLVATPK